MAGATHSVETGFRQSSDIETGFRREDDFGLSPATTPRSWAQASEATSGLQPDPRLSEAEVERILHVQQNYYDVLQVDKDAPLSDMRASYYKLSRLVHPDKCRHTQAGSASAAVNLAYDTLRDPNKKQLYDSYITDQSQQQNGAGMTYAEWEAKQAHVKLPRWLESLLRIPGFGPCLLILLSPVLLIVLLFLLLLYVLALPFRLCTGGLSPSSKGPSAEARPQSAPPRPSKHANGSEVPLQNVTISEPPVTPVHSSSIPFAGPTPPATPPPGTFSDGHQRQPNFATTPQAFALSCPGQSPSTIGLLDSWSHIPRMGEAARRL